MDSDDFSDISLSDADSVDEDLPGELPSDEEGCGMLDKLDFADTELDPTECASDEDDFESYDLRPQRVKPRTNSIIHNV